MVSYRNLALLKRLQNRLFLVHIANDILTKLFHLLLIPLMTFSTLLLFLALFLFSCLLLDPSYLPLGLPSLCLINLCPPLDYPSHLYLPTDAPPHPLVDLLPAPCPLELPRPLYLISLISVPQDGLIFRPLLGEKPGSVVCRVPRVLVGERGREMLQAGEGGDQGQVLII
jgi:hypothetical protein